MHRRPALWLAIILLAAGVVFVVATAGPPPPTPNPPGTFAFAVLGDAPYDRLEEMQFRVVQQDLQAHDLSLVLHIGDIFWRPCSDERYQRSLEWFNRLRHPVIYTPGDNEWADCWTRATGRFVPRERLVRLRQLFFDPPAVSLGGQRMPLASQGGRAPFAEFVENTRWSQAGVVFVTVHLVGSANATAPFAGRTAEDDEAARRRTEAAAAWIRETFAEARAVNASAVVVGFHANPSFERPPGHVDREVYEPFLTALEEEVEAFQRPVLVAQGDDHEYLVDHPFVRRTTGRRLEQLTRLQVPGSPEVGWVRVVVTASPSVSFAFEKRVVPRWKYW